MAQQSAKRLASVNSAALKILFRMSLMIYSSSFLIMYTSGKHYVWALFLSSPGFFAEYLLNKWCMPKYSKTKELLNPGHNFDQGGVIEYTKDIVIINYGITLMAMLLGLRAYFLYLIVPVFASYKGIQLLKVFKQMFSEPSDVAPADQPQLVPESKATTKAKEKARNRLA